MLSQPWLTPWKIWNEIGRWLILPAARILFSLNGITWNHGWRFYGLPIIQKHRHSRMSFGPDLQLRSSVSSNPLGANHPVILATWQAGACLEVGARFCMTGGAICAAKHITIGNGVAVGANTIIADTDFHPIDAAVRWLKPDAGQAAAIVIADDVFIGMNCLILKGVVIGQGSVVGAGSVVTCAVPPHVIAAGNPAKIVREL